MSEAPCPADREHIFRSLYESVYPDLLRFVQRRARPDHADDVTADAFLVVWRRLDELPPQLGDARAWVFGIARNLLLNDDRGEQRRRALTVRLADARTSCSVDAGTEEVVSRVDLGRAWQRLAPRHQEVLALAAFEQLGAPQAAAVLGISPVAFRLRLSRARRALRLHLDHPPVQAARATGIPERTTAP
ncbi:RNA polymerase sigma factor [Cellulomonas sp. URHB0016]